MPRLAGKLALVTGGNSGIGLATAKAFVAEGARVAITGRNQQTLEAAKRELGEGTLALKCDAANLSELDELYAAIKQRLGALDILFANAGIGGISALADTTEETFDAMFDINVKGVFFTVQKALPLLRNGASIILNASIAPHVGRPGASVYAGTKAAVPRSPATSRPNLSRATSGSMRLVPGRSLLRSGPAARATPVPRTRFRHRSKEAFHSAGSAPPMKSRAWWSFSLPMNRATSWAPRSSSMAA